jgi:hypothetical protein
MKTKKHIQILITAVISSMILFNSCKKKDTTTPTPANGTLMFHLHTNVDTNEVDQLGAVYVMTGGRKISVTFAQLYVSGIQLVKPDGSIYSVPGTIMLKKQQNEVYTVGSVPSGNYTSVRFNIGLSAATNASTPGISDTILNVPAMWFGNTAQPSGFTFVNFQGTIDTTTSANGTIGQMQPFTYKIGTNAHLATVSMPTQNFTVSPSQIQYVHMIIDYSKLFTGIKLNSSSNLTIATTSDNTNALATEVANNIPLMFRYEM